MIAYFARHPTAANLLMITLLLLGVLGLTSLKRETFPEFTPSVVTVTVAYPGAAAEDVDEAIVARIEDAVDGIEYLDRMTSKARQGVGVVTLEMEDGGALDAFKSDIDSAVDAITDFPNEAEDPRVAEVTGMSAVASIAVMGPMSVPDLERYCNELKDELRRYEEVSQIEIAGAGAARARPRTSPGSQCIRTTGARAPRGG